jgi:aryl-alcohol dehydrogenase-like predicted oxidoreductase
LSSDYVDLYQIHCFDRRTPLEETLRAFDDLVRCGKVRYIGVSNVTPSQLQNGLMTSRLLGLNRFASLQLEYSLLVRSPEWELIPQCSEEGIGTLAWSPLAGGWLTGKYRREKALPPDSRAGRGDRWDDSESRRGGKRTFDIVDTLVKISEETSHPPCQAAINWILQKGQATCVLTGARTIQQLKENLGSGEWHLSDDQTGRLDAVSDLPVPYPYDFISRYTRA